ncbi:leucine-rich repeat domain-containing protein [Prevotella copri]|uniref:leucine-rich repeat domain-containing protein n=1 Tax=Segatella copri TaxID=165179 RepID=UPI001C3824C0|nr:leucine-rich repeat domain-containing protein [Segatella copri]MBV3413193.1 leucine-rich repeat domain-containing protein [Segatella copri]
MKKFFTLLLAVISTMTAFAQTEPAIELQAEVDGNTRTFTIGLATEGTVQIDWGGNGEKVTSEVIPAYDGWNQVNVSGTVSGDGKVKIYGDNIVYFECSSRVDGAQVLSLDVTKATTLKDLTANTNKLASIDLTKNTELEKLTINNNQLTSIDISKCTKLTTLDITNNLLTAIDITKNQALQTLRIGQNKLTGDLDLSTNPTIKSVYALTNELTSVKIGNNTASKPYFSFNYNKLTSIDASGINDAKNAILFLIGNQLTEIKLPSAQMKTLNISKNNFTLATLPDATTAAKGFTYAPQNDYVIAESYKVGDVLDLSSQTSATLNTQFAVYKSDKTALTEGTDYTVADGKITFLTAQEAVYVTMSSALYSKFTGTSIYKTTVTKVEGSTGINAVTAHGVKISTAGNEISISGLSQGDAVTVANLGGAVVANFHANSANAHVQAAKGLYIVSINGKAIKVSL